MCLQETWMEPIAVDMRLIEDKDWLQNNICLGRGRGLSTIYNQDFQWKANVRYERFQMTLIESEE